MKVYIGEADHNARELKIGYTEQTCWARCKKSDYTIFAAIELPITSAETLFVESYVRLAFNAMTEIKQQIRTDYFLLQDSFPLRVPSGAIEEDLMMWGYWWLRQFVEEAVEIINRKRAFSQTDPVPCLYYHLGYVSPYTY